MFRFRKGGEILDNNLKEKTVTVSYRLSSPSNKLKYLLGFCVGLALSSLVFKLKFAVGIGVIISAILYLNDKFAPGSIQSYIEYIKFPTILYGNLNKSEGRKRE